MSRTVLLVEDDERIRTLLGIALRRDGFSVVEAADGEQGLAVLAAEGREPPPDVVVLDVVLPGMHGFDVCRAVRRLTDVPVIMVTARADSHDVVAGLEAGADDYVTKPFVPQELLARVRALLRRADGASARRPVEAAGLRIVPDESVTRSDGTEVPLTRLELRLLSELAAEAGRVLSREQLLERVWGYTHVGDGRVVDAHMRRLRTKVEEDPANPVLVTTVRGRGYRLQV